MSEIDYNRIPERIKDSLGRYLEHHVQPGHFLTAVLENNLHESFRRADEENRDNLFHLVAYIYKIVPMNAWGSREKVSRWLTCSLCKHPWHGAKPCKSEPGDRYRGAEFKEAMPPCGCAGV